MNLHRHLLIALTMLGSIIAAAQDFLFDDFPHSAMSPMPLQDSSLIAVVSPASIISPQKVYSAIPVLRDQGWRVVTGKNAFARWGTYAGTDEQRYADLSEALMNPDVDAILCSRGGYGVVHILDRIAALPLEENTKWVIGFSDITALHSLLTSRGIPSIHASMAEHIAKGADDVDNQALFKILRGDGVDHTIAPDPLNRCGTAEGMLVGGNMSVLAGLIGTPYDVLQPGTILFIEDVNEPIYKLERILYNLKLAGKLKDLKGLIVGKFAKCAPDDDFSSVNAMVRKMVADYSYPVAYNVPIGHVSHNIPLICGRTATLTITPDTVTIRQ